MCGIVGLYLRQTSCEPSLLARMRDLLAHRGPDDAGTYVNGPIGLGHRRLSIIDLDGGHQPMSTIDGRLTIVFNGEIYNYRDLRRQLEADGAIFRTRSDTEVILQLHARYGNSAVGRLNGIFAYALWDSMTERLWLARDRAGVKPLYYTQSPRGFALGSEIKALFESGLLRPRMDQTRLAEYLAFRQIAGPGSLFEGVVSLLPGHVLEINHGVAGVSRPFWDADRLPTAFEGSFSEAVEALDGTLNAAIDRQMISDVPVGTFCSGGIDSSLVTAIAARKASRPISTYSVGFDDESFDESQYARLAAKACGTVHHELRVSEGEFADALPRLVWHHDLPLNFANSIHIYAVSQIARRDVTVVLTGEGADELFGGYPRYYIPRLLAPIAALPSPLRQSMGAVLSVSSDHRLRKLGAFAKRSPRDWLLFNNATADPVAVANLLPYQGTLDFGFRSDRLNAALAVAPDQVTALAMLDFGTYLISILDRQDKMSMATSLEARVPFLDNEMIDLARSLPLEYRQTLRDRKRVLKRVALRYLPAEIVNRRKSGFGVPLSHWFQGSGQVSRLLDDVVGSSAIDGLLDPRAFKGLIVEHREGRADHSELLWPIVNIALWRREFSV